MKLTLLTKSIGDGFRGGWYELCNNATGVAVAVVGFEVDDDGATFEIDPDLAQRAPAEVDVLNSVNSLTSRYVRVPRHCVAVERI